MEHQQGFWRNALVRICFFAVVEYAELSERRHEPNQIETAAVVALANRGFRNGVTTASDSGSDTLDVKFRTIQAGVPHAHVDPRGHGVFEQRGDRASPERRLEREIAPFGNRFFEQALPFMPRQTVG